MSIFLRGETWQYKFSVMGKSFQGSTGTKDRTIAVEIETERKASLHRMVVDKFNQEECLFCRQVSKLRVLGYWCKVGCARNHLALLARRIDKYEEEMKCLRLTKTNLRSIKASLRGARR